MFKPVIAGFSRSPFTMARKGALVDSKPVNLLAEVIKDLVSKSNVKKDDISELVEALNNEEINQQIETLKMKSAELEQIRIMNKLNFKNEFLNQQNKRKSYEDDVLEQFGPFLNDESKNLNAAKIKDIHENRLAKNALKVFDEHVFEFDNQTPFNNIVDSSFGDKFLTEIKKKSNKSKKKRTTKRLTEKRRKKDKKN